LGTQVLQDAYETWPWFTALVDVVDMVLAKTEPDIARLYDMQLVQAAQQEHPDVAEMVQLGKKLCVPGPAWQALAPHLPPPMGRMAPPPPPPPPPPRHRSLARR
jgi:hypothetical protein